MTTTAVPFDSRLTEAERDLQARARRFVDEILIPEEEAAEERGPRGGMPRELRTRIRSEAIAAGLNGGLHRPEHGGQGWTRMEWFLVQEQFGRSTNGLYWVIPGAYNVLGSASEAQIDRYLRPALAGELEWDYADAYAVTEADAGSDPAGIATTATPTADGWRIDGEKWFVTHGGDCGVYIVMASALVDGGPQPTLFLIDRDADGLEIVDDPDFMHTYPHRHPAIRFTAVEIPRDAVVGEIGAGLDLQRAWFSEERMGIAARGCGSMWRLIEEATAFAIEREQGGQRIFDYQGVAFPLADCAAEAAAARALTLDAVRLADAGADVRLVHAKASMAKLFVSETAFRVADRALQVFGGRGYMRRNVAERLLRELRVDRIWEGTSEIQRVIVARGLERRGVEAIIH